MKMKEQEKRAENIFEIKETENSKTDKEDVYSTKEIKIEEMAIDGICGVY